MLGTDPAGLRREATKAKILDAAWGIARREGLAAVSMRDIAYQVTMRAPSLYTYFASKNDIYDAMYAGAARQLASAVRARRRAADPLQTLRNRIRRFVRFCVEDPLRYQLIFERPVPDFEPSPESFALTIDALEGTRADLNAAGISAERSLDLMRAVFTGIVTLQIANDPGGSRWTRLVDEAFEMFIDHEAARKGSKS
jgi:AcrR family transcriptional regulator